MNSSSYVAFIKVIHKHKCVMRSGFRVYVSFQGCIVSYLHDFPAIAGALSLQF